MSVWIFIGLVLVCFLMGALLLPLYYRVHWERETIGQPMGYAGTVMAPGKLFGVSVAGNRRLPVVKVHFLRMSKTVAEAGASRRKKKPEAKPPADKPVQVKRRRRVKRVKTVVRLLSPGDVVRILRQAAGTMWSWIRPRTIRARLRFGTGDPMFTGVLYGMLWTVGIQQRLDREITPDFLQAGVQGHVTLRGWVMLGGLVWRVCYLMGSIIAFILVQKIRIFTRKIYRAGW